MVVRVPPGHSVPLLLERPVDVAEAALLDVVPWEALLVPPELDEDDADDDEDDEDHEEDVPLEDGAMHAPTAMTIITPTRRIQRMPCLQCRDSV